MLIVGLTGGIGSGKSMVANLFAELGVPIIDADVIAREVITPVLQKIVEYFGAEILNSEGQLNRALLREKIFRDTQARLWLEALLHPLINDEIKRRLKKLHAPYCIVVIPLLLEVNSCNYVQHILVVDSPVELQRSRIQARDHLTIETIDAILETQCSREQRLAAADDIITNSLGMKELTQQVETLHAKFLRSV